MAGILAEEPGLRGGAVGGSGAVLRSVPGMTGGFTRSVWLRSEGGEVGAAGGLPGVDGTLGAEGMAGAIRAVVSAISGAGGNGLEGAGGVATVGALLGVPPGFIATGGPGGGGGVTAGLAN